MPNLGDEILFHTIQELFDGAEMRDPFYRLRREGKLGAWINRRPRYGVVLGGGTLISSPFFLDRFLERRRDLGWGAVFGTGVIDPEFPDDAAMHEWMQPRAAALAECEYIGVRGPRSANTLSSYGIHAEILGDPACSLVKPKGFWTPGSGRIGINVGHSNGKVWGSEDRIASSVSDLAKGLLADKHEINFFVVWPEDLAFTKKVMAHCNAEDAPIHEVYRDSERYLQLTRGLDAFVGVKLHAVILAMCAHVPSIMLEYRPKCRDFMESIGLEQFNIRTDAISGERIRDLLDQLLDSRMIVSEKIRVRFEQLAARQRSVAARLLCDCRSRIDARLR